MSDAKNPDVQDDVVLREENVTKDGGVVKQVLREGSGELPQKGCRVTVDYVGTFARDGAKFDSSYDRNMPFSFRIGKNQVIRAWDFGISSMRVGEIANLLCHHNYCYGEQGSPSKVPPKADLKFRVEVLEIDDPEPHTIAERIKLATKRKEEGNYFFKEGSYNKASYLYDAALNYFAEARVMTEEEEKEVNTLRVACLLNLAASQLKLEDFAKVIQHCSNALALMGENPSGPNAAKALYRRGQAHYLSSDFKDAKADLLRALDISPGSKEVREELEIVKKQEQEYLQKQKNMFQKMFQPAETNPASD